MSVQGKSAIKGLLGGKRDRENRALAFASLARNRYTTAG